MKGYQITFFTQQGRKHKSRAVGEWLIELAKELGLRGATLMNGAEGFGHSGRIHSATFFELADQPQAVIMTATLEQAAALFARLSLEEAELFYIKSAADFGVIGDENQ
jgi:PII-like signaling protein